MERCKIATITRPGEITVDNSARYSAIRYKFKTRHKRPAEVRDDTAAAAYGALFRGIRNNNGTGEKQVIFERNRNSIKDFIAAV